MERWVGKVAVVTGASAGIGAAISKELVKKGLKVVGLARRVEKIEELSKTLSSLHGKLYAVKCDLTEEDDILQAFQWITSNFGSIHILVNNAGLIRPTTLLEGSTEDWRQIFDVNVMALCICTREAIKIMKANNIAGHIIHMNSITGHHVPDLGKPFLNVYPASKFAVTALTESLRQELRYDKLKIKVTSVSPGVVKTNFQDNILEEMQGLVDTFPALKAEDVVEAVMYVLGTGPSVHVQELVICPLGALD